MALGIPLGISGCSEPSFKFSLNANLTILPGVAPPPPPPPPPADSGPEPPHVALITMFTVDDNVLVLKDVSPQV